MTDLFNLFGDQLTDFGNGRGVLETSSGEVNDAFNEVLQCTPAKMKLVDFVILFGSLMDQFNLDAKDRLMIIALVIETNDLKSIKSRAKLRDGEDQLMKQVADLLKGESDA